MIDGELEERVRELRGRGLSPKEIARTIRVRPSAVADLIRAVAAERDGTAADPELVRCWVSPGWSVGQAFGGYGSPPVPAPIDLVRAVVHGAAE